MTKRIKYSKEFKLDAVSLVSEQGYERKAASESLGIRYEMLCRWIKEANKEDGQAFRGQGKLTEEQAELRRLREENKRLKMEKDILKKAAVFFAQETK
jgi:transposase